MLPQWHCHPCFVLSINFIFGESSEGKMFSETSSGKCKIDRAILEFSQSRPEAKQSSFPIIMDLVQ